MDIERLMKDLTVEELENIQINLQTEMEGKKEELRDMVGRRYRDVLEASTEVRQVRQLAESLSIAVGQTRNTQGVVDTRPAPRGQQTAVQRFVALHRLLPLIGDDDGDALSDAFCLLLAENIHKQLVTEHTTPTIHSVVAGLSSRILRTRRSLIESLEVELGELENPDWAANQLTALAMLKDSADLDQLLDMYLDSRKAFVSAQVADSPSLLSIVGHLKESLTVVDQLFVQGELARTMQAVGTPGWRPALVDCLIDDQAFSFHKTMAAEVERINKTQRERKTGQLLTQRINDKCNAWIDIVSTLAHESVSTICDFYEKADDVIEFIHALCGILRDNWPRISTNTSLYQKLFGEVVIDKFKVLITRDLRQLETELTLRLPSMSMAPLPMMEKRAGKFDSLLGVGISRALFDCVCSFYEGVQRVRECCMRYEKVGMETRMDTIKDTLADVTAEIITKLSSLHSSSSETSSCLSRARLCLALIHCDPSTICLTLNRDGDRISTINKTLHAAVEQALSRFACSLAADCLSEAALRDVIESTSQALNVLSTATEWEKLSLPEVGSVEVPLSLCPPLHNALFSLTRRLSDASAAHLLSRGVRKALATEIGRLLSLVLSSAVGKASAIQRTWIQLLFDCRLLNTMFPTESLKQLIPTIESHIDPFDLSLLSTHLSTNIRLAAQRNQLLFSCLLVDVIPSKDTQTSQTYSQVIDIVPRTEHPQRVSLIPRLDRNPAEEVSKRMQNAKTPKNKLLANPNTAGTKNAASLSSLYDKMSSSFSFFGN